MVHENPKRVERKIKRLTSEIEDIDAFFYGKSEELSRLSYMGMLERKRDDLVRSAVLQIHTAIEELITDGIMGGILGTEHHKWYKKRRTERGKALAAMLTGRWSMGFEMKLNFAVVVGIISPKISKQLEVLNVLRNSCSHNWLLDVPIRTGKRRKQARPRLLNFRGRDLHKVTVLKEFLSEYGPIYHDMFVTQRKRDAQFSSRAASSQ